MITTKQIRKISLRRLKKVYGSVIRQAAMYGEKSGKTDNIYVCSSCKESTRTRDLDAGITPMFVQCSRVSLADGKTCEGRAVSKMYVLTEEELKQEPDGYWYRPSFEELKEIRRHASSGVIHHILNGGLLFKENTEKNEERKK